jgi:Putative motility protein
MLMADSEISISSISNQKLQEIQQKAEVSVFKKALKQEESINSTLIQSATRTLPPGVGEKLNTVV